jgi:hypothetical protein
MLFLPRVPVICGTNLKSLTSIILLEPVSSFRTLKMYYSIVFQILSARPRRSKIVHAFHRGLRKVCLFYFYFTQRQNSLILNPRRYVTYTLAIALNRAISRDSILLAKIKSNRTRRPFARPYTIRLFFGYTCSRKQI